MKQYLYTGPLVAEKMPKEAAKAYKSWKDQKARCYKKSHRCYKWYGARGIKVLYGSRTFISWWLSAVSRIGAGKWVCDRISAKKNYCFGNIQLITQNVNAKRQDHSSTRKPVVHLPTGKIFLSETHAAKATGFSVPTVSAHCNRHRKKQRFQYEK